MSQLAAAALLAGLLAVNFYRAATQSIVYDEAITYLFFIHESVLAPFIHFNANNHVLFSALAAVSTRVFGVSEFALRLPTALGAVLYFAAVFGIARDLCDRATLFLLTVAALSLNPVVFDFLSAARGYGLATSWLAVGLFFLLRGGSGEQDIGRTRTAASVALGLSVCSNLAFLFPVAGLLLTATVIELRRSTLLALTRLWIPGALVAAAILAAPLMHSSPDQFYFGATSLRDTIASLVHMSFVHHPTRWTSTLASQWIVRIAGWVAVGSVALAIARATILLRARRFDPLSRALLLLAGTWIATLGMLVSANVLVDLPYPLERTGLYFIPLVIVTIVATGRSFTSVWPARVAAAALAILVATSIEQFAVRSYTTWRFDAGSRDVATVIASLPVKRPLRVATSEWLYEPALEYYNVVRFAGDRMPSIKDGFDPAHIDEFDVLVVSDADLPRIDRRWWRIYTHPVSGAHVLVNPRLLH
jgi:4-amino-4-deoxy-L-arabinose transferase-like glycosyltransferase